MRALLPGGCRTHDQRPGRTVTYRMAMPRTVPAAPAEPAADAPGPVVSADHVRFAVPDEHRRFSGLRLEIDRILTGSREFTWADGVWSLQIPRPDCWRLEYQLTTGTGTHSTWMCDPANPLRVPNPFGDKSELRFPRYRLPNWLLTPPDGPLLTIHTPKRELSQAVPVRLWSPPGLPAETGAPLLVAHDGSDMADRGSLLRWAAALSRVLPIRVGLLDPPVGLRDEWYAANPDYADHVAEVVIPALTGRVRTGAVIGLGASLGAVAMLTIERRHPGALGALALQSGSFFTHALDGQESSFPYFERICTAVAAIAAGPDRAPTGGPRPVPVLITCGGIEENLANNRAMAAALHRQGHPVTLREVPDAHTMIGWRDAWFPALDGLIGSLQR